MFKKGSFRSTTVLLFGVGSSLGFSRLLSVSGEVQHVKIRVLSGIYASLDLDAAKTSQINLLSETIQRMAHPIKSQDETSDLIVTGGLLDFYSTPAAVRPREPREVLQVMFQGQLGLLPTEADKAIKNLGLAIKAYVASGRRFVWLLGSRESGVTLELISHFWDDLDTERFLIVKDTFPTYEGILFSSGLEADFFAKAVPPSKRPFSYYINRALATSSSRCGMSAEEITHKVFADAEKEMSLDTVLSALQIVDKKRIRTVLARAMQLALCEDSTDFQNFSLRFVKGHWNAALDKDGVYYMVDNPQAESSSPPLYNPSATESIAPSPETVSSYVGGANAPNVDVSVPEVIDAYLNLMDDWIYEVGRITTSIVAYVTATRDYEVAIPSFEQNPEVAAVGHSVEPIYETTRSGVFLLSPGSWTESRNVSCSYADITLGPIWTGAVRATRIDRYRVLSLEGDVQLIGAPWLRARQHASTYQIFWILTGAAAAAVALIILLVLFYVMSRKDNNLDTDDMQSFVGYVELSNPLSRSNRHTAKYSRLATEEVPHTAEDHLLHEEDFKRSKMPHLVSSSSMGDMAGHKDEIARGEAPAKRSAMGAATTSHGTLYPLTRISSKNIHSLSVLTRCDSQVNVLVEKLVGVHSAEDLKKIKNELSTYLSSRKRDQRAVLSRRVSELAGA